MFTARMHHWVCYAVPLTVRLSLQRYLCSTYIPQVLLSVQVEQSIRIIHRRVSALLLPIRHMPRPPVCSPLKHLEHSSTTRASLSTARPSLFARVTTERVSFAFNAVTRCAGSELEPTLRYMRFLRVACKGNRNPVAAMDVLPGRVTRIRGFFFNLPTKDT